MTRRQTYHLNLPTKITFAGNKEIAYTYDAAGTKLSKTATQNGTAISQTDYVNGHIYQDGQLEFFGMAEGRMYAQRDANGNFEALKPEYHLTDHLGNLRVAWRPEQTAQTNSFLMTAEPKNRAEEDTTFQNLAEAPKAKGYKSANSVSLSQYDAPISKEFIPLEKNQEVEISVLGLREVIENAEESDIPTSVEKSESGIVPVPIIVNRTETHNSGDAAKQGSVRANLLGIIPFAKKLFSKKKEPAPAPRKPNPEGELVISFYDSTKELLSTEILSLKSENEWETLSFSTKAEEKGFVSASIRGTSAEPAKFDDFSIQLKSLYSAKLYQENHYYPFGMNMKGLESSDKQTQQNKKEHEWQFNAQTEREESFGLFWDETPFRPMDAQLGRFWGVDLLAEAFVGITPFHYAYNNPIGFNDPTGLVGEGTEVEQSEEQAWYSREMIPSASQSAGVDTPTGGGADLVTDPGTGSGGGASGSEDPSPVYDKNGNFLGTDDKGLQGPAIVMEASKFTQGMAHSDALSHDLGFAGINGLGNKQKFLNHYQGLSSRPDYDGHLTFFEVTRWSNSGNGASLFVDASKINLGHLSIEAFSKKSSLSIDFFQGRYGGGETGPIYGHIQITLLNRKTGKVRLGLPGSLLDVHDFKNKYFKAINDALWFGSPNDFNIYCAPCETFIHTEESLKKYNLNRIKNKVE